MNFVLIINLTKETAKLVNREDSNNGLWLKTEGQAEECHELNKCADHHSKIYYRAFYFNKIEPNTPIKVMLGETLKAELKVPETDDVSVIII